MTLDLEFKGKYLITGRIVLETGLHIGGATEGFEIGGVDNPVIRDPLTEWPYIPGSSLKGKLRHLLEWSLGANDYTEKPHHFTEGRKSTGEPTFQPCSCAKCEACRLFGVTPQTGVQSAGGEEKWHIMGPTRLTVRDAFPTSETIDLWQKYLGEKIYTELKTENAIDRVTSEANPRTMERVPAGSEFDFEMVFDVFNDDCKKLLVSLFSAMHLLENSALGGSGTRGHGKVKFADLKIIDRSKDYYLGKEDQIERLVSERSPKAEFPEKPTHHTFKKGLSGAISYEQSLPKHLAAKLEEVLKG